MTLKFSSINNLINQNVRKLVLSQTRLFRRMPVRKPIWYPTAPSKFYDINPKPKYSKEKQSKLEELEKKYALEYRSIQHYLKDNFYNVATQGGMTLNELKAELDEQKKLIEENNAENQRIAAIRKQYQKEEEIEEEKEIMLQKLKENEQYLIKKEEIKQQILIEKKRYETYITLDKLVSAIEQAIENPTTYEYAIDLKGKVIFDKKLHPFAFKPTEVPNTSSVIDEYIIFDDQVHYLEENKILV